MDAQESAMDLVAVLIYLGPPAFFVLLGLVVGTATERRHLGLLEQREAACSEMLVTDLRSYSPDHDPATLPSLVTGEAVIATDYLKTFLAGLRNLLGGEVRSYLTLVNRARREALMRMLESARGLGYDAVCNVRLEPADIGGSTYRKGVPMAAMVASGTAYRRGPASPAGATAQPDP